MIEVLNANILQNGNWKKLYEKEVASEKVDLEY